MFGNIPNLGREIVHRLEYCRETALDHIECKGQGIIDLVPDSI